MSSIAALRDLLLAARNPDGGWGYYSGKASRLEPTCWAALALNGLVSDREQPARALARWPSNDGLLLEHAGGDGNFGFHALAVLTLVATGVEHNAGTRVLISTLERGGGVRFPQSTINRQNNQLQGWSWIGDTFSWVEPTALAVLALKRARATGASIDQARVREAEAVLLDRVCGTGGWNYGNSNMLGRELHAYAPTTAVALLALQDHRDEVPIQRSIEFLERQATWECSAYALSLSIIAGRILGVNTASWSDALGRQIERTYDLGQQLGIALALYALRDDHGDAAFRLGGTHGA